MDDFIVAETNTYIKTVCQTSFFNFLFSHSFRLGEKWQKIAQKNSSISSLFSLT